MFWSAQTIHFIDFEGNAVSGILEYGVVTLRGGEIVSTQTRLCRPTGKVRARESAIHGIYPGAIAEHAPFADEFETFARLRESGPLAAHFANVENSLLKAVWPYPREVPDFVRGGGAGVLDWGPWIDTGRLYPQFYRGLASSKLGGLIDVFGLQPELDAAALEHCPEPRRHYHAALYDALAGALLLKRLAAEPGVAALSLARLLILSTLDGEKRGRLEQADLF